MRGINEATDTDPCLILAGTSLKVIDPVRKNFLTALKDYSNSAGSAVFLILSAGGWPKRRTKRGNLEDTREMDLNPIVRSVRMIIPSEPWQIHPIG